MSNAERNRSGVEESYKAFFQGDLEGFLKNFDAESEFREAESLPYGGSYFGKDEAKVMIQKMLDTWDNMAYDIDEITASEHYVITYGIFSAVGKKTGTSVKFPIAECWKFRDDGKVALLYPMYADTHTARIAAGAV